MNADLGARLKRAAERYQREQLAVVKARLYKTRPAGEFQRDRRLLLQAICAPAQYLHERSLKLPGSRYAAILAEAMSDIERGGDIRGIRRTMGVYFLHCVQKHLQVRGERYLEEAKGLAAGRPVCDLLGAALNGIRPVSERAEADLLTAVLAAASAIAKPRKVAFKGFT